jgi:hypothetical protein
MQLGRILSRGCCAVAVLAINKIIKEKISLLIIY